MDGDLRSVVVHLHHVRRQIDIKRGGVVNFQSLVVARALHVFTDDQVVAKTGCAALQNVHEQGVGRQAVAAERRGAQHHISRLHSGGVEAVLVAQSPNVVHPCLAKRREVEVGFVGGRENLVVFIANEEDVLPFHGIAVVPKRNQRSILCQARFGIHFTAGRQQSSTIAGGNFTRLAHHHHRVNRHAHTPTRRHRLDRVERRQAFGQNQIVRDGVHLKHPVTKAFHVQCCAEKHALHFACFAIHNSQACQTVGRIRRVRKAHNGGAQIRAKCGVGRVVQFEVAPFAGQHVAHAGTQRLDDKILVQACASIGNARQTVGTCIGSNPRLRHTLRRSGVDQRDDGLPLWARHKVAPIEHGIRNSVKRGGGSHLERRRRRTCQHHSRQIALPCLNIHKVKALIVEGFALQVHQHLGDGHPRR